MNPLMADHIGPLDMFKIGIGPSSSHTVGPMVAALDFRRGLQNKLLVTNLESLRLEIELYGSLAATGAGHYTDAAVCAGLAGLSASGSEPEAIWAVKPALETEGILTIDGYKIAFNPARAIVWKRWSIDGQALPHPNTIRFRLWAGTSLITEETALSVGGGFVETVDPASGLRRPPGDRDADVAVPYPYNSAAEFIKQCTRDQMKPWEIVIANEAARGLGEDKLRARLAEILAAMEASIERGLAADGILPGGLNVRRRARKLYEQSRSASTPAAALSDLRPSCYAMAVNEENAAGGRVVTAPTNGSAGIIPAVWRRLRETHQLSASMLENGLMAASVIGALVKVHASISGAEVGCQGEVGTSCAMAAAGAVAMLGGTPDQMEMAAEIGIEHHLGMTCDPIKGLVQVPCIERNAMGAVKALNAAALSMASDGAHLISLDKALAVMKQTGLDMNRKYKETATGGLALG